MKLLIEVDLNRFDQTTINEDVRDAVSYALRYINLDREDTMPIRNLDNKDVGFAKVEKS